MTAPKAIPFSFSKKVEDISDTHPQQQLPKQSPLYEMVSSSDYLHDRCEFSNRNCVANMMDDTRTFSDLRKPVSLIVINEELFIGRSR
jgi:hypothetical protein